MVPRPGSCWLVARAAPGSRPPHSGELAPTLFWLRTTGVPASSADGKVSGRGVRKWLIENKAWGSADTVRHEGLTYRPHRELLQRAQR